jgi:hypothetical protein
MDAIAYHISVSLMRPELDDGAAEFSAVRRAGRPLGAHRLVSLWSEDEHVALGPLAWGDSMARHAAADVDSMLTRSGTDCAPPAPSSSWPPVGAWLSRANWFRFLVNDSANSLRSRSAASAGLSAADTPVSCMIDMDTFEPGRAAMIAAPPADAAGSEHRASLVAKAHSFRPHLSEPRPPACLHAATLCVNWLLEMEFAETSSSAEAEQETEIGAGAPRQWPCSSWWCLWPWWCL